MLTGPTTIVRTPLRSSTTPNTKGRLHHPLTTLRSYTEAALMHHSAIVVVLFLTSSSP
jgi:hypothetical protein